MIRLLLLFILLFPSYNTKAQLTKIIVRAKAKDAKFIGTSVGGAFVTIRESDTGEVLAKGLTIGSTGNTKQIMSTPHERYQALSDENTAKFEAELNLEQPTFITIEVKSPYTKKQAQIIASTQLWLIPGKHVLGDGVILEIPGFIIDILEPQTHRFLSIEKLEKKQINIRANIVMMCGCTISKGGLWDGEQFEVKAILKEKDKIINTFPLNISSTSNIFEGSIPIEQGGLYEIIVYAYDSKTGNTGVDKVNFVLND